MSQREIQQRRRTAGGRDPKARSWHYLIINSFSKITLAKQALRSPPISTSPHTLSLPGRKALVTGRWPSAFQQGHAWQTDTSPGFSTAPVRRRQVSSHVWERTSMNPCAVCTDTLHSTTLPSPCWQTHSKDREVSLLLCSGPKLGQLHAAAGTEGWRSGTTGTLPQQASTLSAFHSYQRWGLRSHSHSVIPSAALPGRSPRRICALLSGQTGRRRKRSE